MADDQNVTSPEGSPEGSTPGAKKSLPPLRSAPGAAGRTPVPPLRPKPSTPVPSQPVAAPQLQQPAQEGDAQPAPVNRPAPIQTRAAVPAAPRVVKPKQDKPPENDQGIWRMSRKNFLNVTGWFAFFGFLATATVGAIRLMVPRVLYEQPSAFKAGFPEDYIIGEVNEKYKDEFRVWIVRESDGFYALSAICTHLGCTPRWLATESKFKCPCHGSGYHKDGINFEGPTPRPLERLKISLADDGQILIDRAVKFLYEKQEWSKPEAFLKYV
jgi:cytochrome b6-f complex iron-sulfur subunit